MNRTATADAYGEEKLVSEGAGDWHFTVVVGYPELFLT